MSKTELDNRLDCECRNWIERRKAMEEEREKVWERGERSVRAMLVIAAVVGVVELVVAVWLASGGGR
jgi:vacuolar-type H+-ATPase subunit H